MLGHQGRRDEVIALDRVPVTLGGAARHNVANALAAAATAVHLGFDLAAIRAGLAAFDSSPAENPGRLNRFDLGGAQVLVDFAHNPHGLEALLSMAAALPASRRLVVLGQAGDRDDEAIRELARIVWRPRPGRPDRIVVKEMPQYLRGRAAGEVPELDRGRAARAGRSRGRRRQCAIRGSPRPARPWSGLGPATSCCC